MSHFMLPLCDLKLLRISQHISVHFFVVGQSTNSSFPLNRSFCQDVPELYLLPKTGALNGNCIIAKSLTKL